MRGIVVTPHYLVSAADDGTICAWDVAERICKTSASIEYGANGIAGSKNEDVVLLWNETQVYRWDLTSKAPTLIASPKPIRTFLSASADLKVWVEAYAPEIRVFDAQSGKTLRELKLPESESIQDLVMAPDGERFAVSLSNGELRVEPTKGARSLFTTKTPPVPKKKNRFGERVYTALGWDETGKKLAACSAPTLEIWSFAQTKPTRENEMAVEDGYCDPVRWSKDGAGVVLAATASSAFGLFVEAAQKGASSPSRARVEFPGVHVSDLVFVDDQLLAGSESHLDIHLHAYPSLARVGELRTRDPRALALAWDGQGDRLAWLTPTRRLLVLDTQKMQFDVDHTGQWVDLREHTVPLMFDGQDHLFVGKFLPNVGKDPRSGTIWDARSGVLLGHLESSYSALGTGPNGLFLGAYRFLDPDQFKVEFSEGKATVVSRQKSFRDSISPYDTAIATDGSGRAIFFTGTSPPELQTYSGSNTPKVVLLQGASRAGALRGSVIVTGSSKDSKQILRWDEQGKAAAPWTIDCIPKKFAISADLNSLAVACGDEGLRVVSLADGRELLRGNGPIWALAFHPRLPVLAVGGNDLQLVRMDRAGSDAGRLEVHYVDRKDHAYPVIVSKTAVDAPDAAAPALVIHEVDSGRARPLSEVRVAGLLRRFLDSAK